MLSDPRALARRICWHFALLASLSISAACYRDLDPANITCQVGNPGSCPPDYECLLVNGKTNCCKEGDARCGQAGDGSVGPVALDSSANVDSAGPTGFDARDVDAPLPDSPGAMDGMDGSSARTGGITGSGGRTGLGGTSGGGGIAGVDGTDSAGGATSSGGMARTGGMSGSGGASSPGTGGQTAAGGSNGTGGRTGTGGLVGTGGRSGSGGQTGSGGQVGTGGHSGTGGLSGTGGRSGTGGGTGGGGNPSLGCGKAITRPDPQVQQTIDVGQTTRYYLIDVPSTADNNTPLLLIFALHGYDMNNLAIVDLYDFPSRSGGKAITVYPQGEGPPPGDTPHWGDGVLKSTWSSNEANYTFFSAMISELEGRYCIDTSRVFITGFSMGGMFTNTIACAHHDWFRGFAPVEGQGPGSCANAAAKPAIMIHQGTADMIVTPSAGAESHAFWIEQNGCSQTTTSTFTGCTSNDACAQPVVYCVGNWDHTIASTATANIWAFFSGL